MKIIDSMTDSMGRQISFYQLCLILDINQYVDS